MRTALILLAMTILAFAEEAEANTPPAMRADQYTIEVFGQKFGFVDIVIIEIEAVYGTSIFLGPLGSHRVPFSAQKCLFGCFVILIVLMVMLAFLATRRKRKRE